MTARAIFIRLFSQRLLLDRIRSRWRACGAAANRITVHNIRTLAREISKRWLSQLHGGPMQTHTRLLLGSIGILALVGCSGYDDNNYGSAPGYLVNGIAAADVD